MNLRGSYCVHSLALRVVVSGSLHCTASGGPGQSPPPYKVGVGVGLSIFSYSAGIGLGHSPLACGASGGLGQFPPSCNGGCVLGYYPVRRPEVVLRSLIEYKAQRLACNRCIVKVSQMQEHEKTYTHAKMNSRRTTPQPTSTTSSLYTTVTCPPTDIHSACSTPPLRAHTSKLLASSKTHTRTPTLLQYLDPF